MSLLQNSNAISTGGAYNLESSLRLRESASAYLSRTPTSTGDRQKFTISTWVKFSKQNSSLILNSGNTVSDRILFRFSGTNGQFHVIMTQGGTNYGSLSNAYLRDPSAWYHLVLAVDTTQATSTNRLKGYINGEEITSWSSYNLPSQNYNMHINLSGTIMAIGADPNASTYQSDAYYSEYNFIDGQQLTADDFGEYDTTTGVWKPKKYTGTYGTNGFYLPMKETQQATGFNTVLYTGTGAVQDINNVGFSPDFVWIKARDSAQNHYLADSVRSGNKYLYSNGTSAELTTADGITFESNGFQMKNTGNVTNGSGLDYVAWCWDAGSSTVSNTDGTITSSVRANPATGFSIVTYTGTGANATVGHGLGSAPDMIIVKNRDNTKAWLVYHSANTAEPETDYLVLNDTVATADNIIAWNDTAPTSSVFSLGTSQSSNESGNGHVAYCFSEVAGYSKFGSYTGNGSTSGPTVTTGFRPAFVLIKNASTGGLSWVINDNTRGEGKDLSPNVSSAESTPSPARLTFTDTGFNLISSANSVNQSGATHIYMAFADTRDAQFNFDASGNKNNWTANNINSNASSEPTYDIMNDVPTLTDEDTANFCTLNPLDRADLDLPTSYITNGNLEVDYTNTAFINANVYGSIYVPKTGKWYFEARLNNYYGSSGLRFGFNAGSAYLEVSAVGDYAIAVDWDNELFWTRTNGTWTGDPEAGTGGTSCATSATLIPPYVRDNSASTGNGGEWIVNFGQRPFKYSQPTGFKKINTYNLPDSTIKDGSQYMNTVLYTGNGSTQSITGVGFSPDFIWIKERSSTSGPQIHDSIRGAYRLYTNLTNAEEADSGWDSFDADGYSMLGGNNGINESGQTYVAWNWRGSDSSAVSNTDGTITSTVSANTTSGFSVVTYTGDGNASSTVGHGLGSAPEMIIVKRRDLAANWAVWHQGLSSYTHKLYLNTTDAEATGGNAIDAAPTSTVLELSSSGNSNTSGRNYVAYCFSEVEGFSKFGSYTGNGSTDGPFVYTGFRPAFVMVKGTNVGASQWSIIDSQRDTSNACNRALFANLTNTEGSSDQMDFLSNGFKVRNTFASGNQNTINYIYMAFAENPFKHSLAR